MKNSIKYFLLTNLVAFSLNAFADNSDILPKSKLSKTEMQTKLKVNQCYTTEDLYTKDVYICKNEKNEINEFTMKEITSKQQSQAYQDMLKEAGVFF